MSNGVVYLPAGLAQSITIDVIISGQYAPPLDNLQGILRIDGEPDVVLDYPPTGGSQFIIEIPAVTVPTGSTKKASLALSVRTALGSRTIRKVYRFLDVFDIPTDRDAVRSLLGVSEDEIGDIHIPLDQTYIEAYNQEFSASFHLLRVSDASLSDQFGLYLALRTALKCLPSMAMLLAKKETTENGEFSRLGSASDLEKLAQALQEQLNELLEDLAEYMLEDAITVLNTIRFIEMTPDEITGV